MNYMYFNLYPFIICTQPTDSVVTFTLHKILSDIYLRACTQHTVTQVSATVTIMKNGASAYKFPPVGNGAHHFHLNSPAPHHTTSLWQCTGLTHTEIQMVHK